MIKTVAPDVLVAPSSLPPFVKVIDSVLVVNPGHLSKRRGAGTYARMIVQAPPTSDAEMSSGGLIAHRVYSRARVDIIRI
ncbi:hypothetical protein VTK73DRAFT_5534 [Phialemonium thermophilum]|uniref:DNA polymerase alpha subunit B n=1 Tax=Phialemonium thermophilum TaxID=223376 RepID=A0ABR3V1S4_9PEZI